MIEALLGGLLGPLFRMIPELITFFDKKNERAHELSMQSANLEADKARYANSLAVANVAAESSRLSGAMTAYQEALKGQFQLTGVPFIDGLNMSVRPVVTYAFFALYALIKANLLYNGVTIAGIWTDTDMGLFSGILSFYFMGRVFDRK